MSPNQRVDEVKTKLSGAVSHFNEELKKLRTGRAHPSMLDVLMIQAYGTSMPLLQVGSVTTPEAQLLQITPFDPGNIAAIANAIRDNQSLGLNPTDDGRVVRVPIPALNEERRREIVKQLHQKVEETMISMRQIRQDAMKHGDQAKKDKSWGDDDHSRYEKQVDEIMTEKKTEIDQLARTKEHEILTV